MHRDIFAVLEGLETGEPLVRGDKRAFTFRARVRGVEFNAMILAEFNGDAQIADLTLFARPLPATATLFSALPPRVAARRRGRPMGALVAARKAHALGQRRVQFHVARQQRPDGIGVPTLTSGAIGLDRS